MGVILRPPFVCARTEIGNFSLEASRDENIVRLKVAVDDSNLPRVQVAHALNRADNYIASKLVVTFLNIQLSVHRRMR